MWSRKVLKEKAKERVHVNYWKMVLVGFILSLLIGSGGGSSLNFTNRFDNDSNDRIEEDIDAYFSGGDIDDFEDAVLGSMLMDNLGILSLGLGIIVMIALVIAIPLSIFVFNPILLGCRRFFYRNIEESARVGELAFAFDKNFLNNVKIMFFVDLYTFLWSLLFVIPGIVKSYEYRMIPYLLAENPDMSKEEAFAISKRMMDGNKWKAFVFDLSFIGWRILGSITFGIVDLFYVNPYYFQADAMLYDAIKIDDMNHYGSGFGNQNFDQSFHNQFDNNF